MVCQLRKDEVIDLLKLGMSNSDIGETLCMSQRTVKGYMTQIMQELNVNNRTQAALVLHGLKICKLN